MIGGCGIEAERVSTLPPVLLWFGVCVAILLVCPVPAMFNGIISDKYHYDLQLGRSHTDLDHRYNSPHRCFAGYSPAHLLALHCPDPPDCYCSDCLKYHYSI